MRLSHARPEGAVMAWLEAHQELGRHRKTKALARALGISRAEAVGHLMFMWWWALDHAPNGDLRKFSTEEIAEEALWDGDAAAFVGALRDAGWLDKSRIHHWDEYAGRLIQQRERAKERARTARATSAQRTRTVRAPYAQRTRLQDPTQHNTTQQDPEPKLAALPRRDSDPLFEALCIAQTGSEYAIVKLTEGERGKINKAAGQIRGAGYSAEEVPEALSGWPMAMGDARVTAIGLAGNFARCLRSARDGATFNKPNGRSSAAADSVRRDRAMAAQLREQGR